MTVPSSKSASFFMSVRLAPVTRRATGMPLASVSRCRLVPGLPRSVGFAPRGLRLASAPFLPNGALTMHPSAACQVQSSPISPSYCAQQDRPRPLQRSGRDPLAEALVDGGLGSELAGQLGPLAAGAGQPDQPVEDGPVVAAGTTRLLARLVALQDRRQQRPQMRRRPARSSGRPARPSPRARRKAGCPSRHATIVGHFPDSVLMAPG